jgi:hypothetical protein
MYNCQFTLNGSPMSQFVINGRAFPVFSGPPRYINKRSDMRRPQLGPIPVGKHCIVDRLSGGRLGWLYERRVEKTDGFALFADDGRIDDHTSCDQVIRGNFRLHPAVGTGASRGCITLPNMADFTIVRGLLRSVRNHKIPCADISAYGKVTVL